MALNFPDSPTLNQVYTDTTSGFSYQWDGVVWQSYSAPASKNISIVDDISGSFDSSTQTFSLAVSGTALTPANAQQLRVVLGGIVQEPGVDYTVSGSNITFTTPPSGGLDCSIVSLGPAVPVNTIIDGTVTPAKLSTGGPYWNAGGDLNVSGVVTATSFVGNLTGDATGLTGTPNIVVGVATASSFVGNLTGDATGLTGTPNVIVGVVTATSVSVSGNVSIAGTLTYEDVTNIDSIGIVTARSGVNVTGGDVTLGTGVTISGATSNVFTLSTNGSERVRVDSSGNFGIGTQGPQAPLHVRSATNANLYVDGNAPSGGLRLNSVNDAASANGPLTLQASGHIFVDSGTERARIDSSGRLGIGTGVPGTKLDVVETGSTSSIIRTKNDTTSVYLDANNGYAYLNTFSNHPLLFGTNNLERARIDSSGRFGVGTAAPSESLHVIGNILASGNVTGYSDETLKDNIQTIPDALDKVSQLRGVEFDRNDIEGNPHQIGVIAQEVEQVIPEVVTTHDDGIKSVAYGNLVGVLIEAIKELKEEVNELKARLEEV